MAILSLWTARFGLLFAGLGIWFSFQKGDGPAPDWGFVEHVAQSTGAALAFGAFGAGVGLVFDLLGAMFRRSKKFAQDMREQNERL